MLSLLSCGHSLHFRWHFYSLSCLVSVLQMVKWKCVLATSTKTKDYVVPVQKLKGRVSVQQRPGEVISPTVGLFLWTAALLLKSRSAVSLNPHVLRRDSKIGYNKHWLSSTEALLHSSNIFPCQSPEWKPCSCIGYPQKSFPTAYILGHIISAHVAAKHILAVITCIVFTVDPLAPDCTINCKLFSGKLLWRPRGMQTYRVVGERREQNQTLLIK